MTVVQQSTTPEQPINPFEKNGTNGTADHGLVAHEETEAMGSYNHSMIQTNIGFLLKQLGTYSVFTELSLDSTAKSHDSKKSRGMSIAGKIGR